MLSVMAMEKASMKIRVLCLMMNGLILGNLFPFSQTTLRRYEKAERQNE